MFNATSISKSLVNTKKSSPSTAFLAALIATNIKGIIKGKLKTGISRLPLPDFDAIAESKVNVDEKPIAPSIVISINNFGCCTGKPKKILNANKHSNDNTIVMQAL